MHRVSETGIDLHRILVEIDEEVRAKRASGELPAELERELDLVFARFAPAGAVEGDFEQLMARAEQQSFIDLLAPNESVRPGVPQVKRVVQKTIRWYVRYVVEQFSGFAHTITKAMRKLSSRVDAIDELRIGEEDLSALPVPARDVHWDSAVVDTFRSVEGRVLHGRCATGDLVDQLVSAGVDAYGVDPASALIATGTGGDAALDLRPDDERAHMRTLAAGALGGLVISGSVDVLPVGAQIDLVDLAAIAVAPGATIVVITANPGTQSPVITDLAPGKPLHMETWAYLLADRGFTVDRTERTQASSMIIARAPQRR